MTQAPEVVGRLRAELDAAKYPRTYRVSLDDIYALEDYYKQLESDARKRWRDAGCPDDWNEQMWFTHSGPHFGLMFKGVELIGQ